MYLYAHYISIYPYILASNTPTPYPMPAPRLGVGWVWISDARIHGYIKYIYIYIYMSLYIWHRALHLVSHPGLQSTALNLHRDGSMSATIFGQIYDTRMKLWSMMCQNVTFSVKTVTRPPNHGHVLNRIMLWLSANYHDCALIVR